MNCLLVSIFSVSKYQDEEAKKKIIRLKQCARASLQRLMSSHGALTLYGRHLKHYIKKPEVHIQVVAWYFYCLLDAITLSGQRFFIFQIYVPIMLICQCLCGSGAGSSGLFGYICLILYQNSLPLRLHETV